MIRVENAREADAEWIASRLRADDVEEIRVSSCLDPHAALAEAWRISTKVRVLRPAKEASPFAIYGVARNVVLPKLGIVWLLATPQMRHHIKDTLRASRQLLTELAKDYPEGLHNLVWTGNHTHVKWCLSAGFTVLGDVPRNGHTFIHVHWTPKCVIPSR